MFIFNLSENFLHNIFDSNDPGCNTEFIDDNGNTFLVPDKQIQQPLCRHRLRYDQYPAQRFGNRRRIFEKSRYMNITDNIVDTFFINQNPGQSGIDKELGQLFDRTVDRQGYDIRAGNDTLPQLHFGKIECIPKKFDLVHFLLLPSIDFSFLDQVIQIYFSKSPVGFFMP